MRLTSSTQRQPSSRWSSVPKFQVREGVAREPPRQLVRLLDRVGVPGPEKACGERHQEERDEGGRNPSPQGASQPGPVGRRRRR